MKATVKVSDKLVIDNVEGSTSKELFERIAEVYKVFEDKECGKCKSKNIYPSVRKVDDNNFYEMVCGDCHHKLSYGHAKDGSGMYPKRSETDGKGKAKKENGKVVYLENKGWKVYSGDE